ncbi:MAG: DoxX family protein [Bacteroidales bacterium]|nr:DoxX family protein [Bacteroidales bacterium]
MKRLSKAIIVLLHTTDNYRSLIPRIIVGLVFISEGIQKFLFPELVGAGRFEKIGFSNPEFLALFVASFEIICGFMVLTGFVIRLASIPLLTIMVTAIITTKIPILLNRGFWSMAHESRTDFAMLLLLVYMIIYGSGKWSFDRLFSKQ